MKIKKKKKEKKKDVYDFAFKGNKEKLSSKEKKLAIDLMAKHFRFFGEINYLKENEAVLRGAKITCTHGNKTICLDTYKDHGVYDHEIPVMTCSDCKQGQNIYSFGACGNDKFEPVYSEQLPAPKGYVKDAQGVDRHKCLPLLDKSWGTGGAKSRIAIVCFNGIGSGDWLWNKMDYTDERKLAVLEEYSGMINKGEYVEILLSQANLLCLYGGVITIEQNPEVDEDSLISVDEDIESIDEEQIIEEFISKISGEKISEYDQMVKLDTVEILARMIYQENHNAGDGQNRIMFSVVNRICFQKGYLITDQNNEKKVNNLYGIVTSGKQYQSIWDYKDANEKTKNNKYNAYWPPNDENANPSEKKGWENAKRLAALLYYSVEIYGDGENTDRGKCVGSNNKLEVRENIIEFLEQHDDNEGNEIINTVGEAVDFRSGKNGKNVFK